MWAWEEVGELPPFQPGYKPLSPAGATRELLELTRELIPVARLVGRVEEWASFAANLDLHVQDNAVVKVTSPLDHSVTSGNLCIKGRFGFEHIQAERRDRGSGGADSAATDQRTLL